MPRAARTTRAPVSWGWNALAVCGGCSRSGPSSWAGVGVCAPDSARGSLVDPIARASAHIADGELAAGLEAAAGAAPPQVAALLHQAARAIENEPRGDEPEAALLQLLVELRAGLRAAKQWALADQVRDRLAVLGYELRDTPEGTVWERHR